MRITKKWIDENTTRAGGYTRKMVSLLGVPWPLVVGWKERLVGREISDALAAEFCAVAKSSAPVRPRFEGAVEVISAEKLTVWTDGACEPNPGQGGWGWHRSDGAHQFGGEPVTTNNRMEMTAILRALEALPDGAQITVLSDSMYCVNGLTIWAKAWARRNWMQKGAHKAEPLANRELWLALEAQKRRVKAEFRWVRGHNGDPGNERADELAEMGRASILV